ncbi:hypothetical protein LJR225_001889 [Phenylobacterium sp. LjRoot225]|uniref:hypothetical protein n=1 Tax=Phenylobacterium sp. LjRoot225 TaxID=3342285 RepID=UPI003ECE8A92
MFQVPTPRGDLNVSRHDVAKASDRLFPLSSERRNAAHEKARKVLSRRDSRRAAAIVAAAAALAALLAPATAI